jgi:RNA polymerase sigma-70 factor (ECF subfamily)
MDCVRLHFAPKAEVVPGAIAIARRLIIYRFRRVRHEAMLNNEVGEADDTGAREAPSPEAGPDAAVERQQVARRIERALARLPEAHREAFELVKRDELSMAEAAQVLGTTVAAVKLRAHRCYEALRVSLADLADEWQVERE